MPRALAIHRSPATRHRTSRYLVLAVAVAVAALVIGFVVEAGAAPPTPLVIAANGASHTFNVELAATEKERQVGLMFRRKMAPDAGMLFDYVRSQRVAMWMKNTYIPLDMLFIAGDGRVVNIAKRTVPHSLTSIPSAGRVRAVLELNAGTSDRLGIKPGDQVRHRIFGNLASK